MTRNRKHRGGPEPFLEKAFAAAESLFLGLLAPFATSARGDPSEPQPTHKESPMSLRSHFAALAALATLCTALPTTLVAQQVVCLSLHAGPATGTNSTGQPAQVAAQVEGVHVAIPTTAGQSAAAASAAHEAAFNAAGFTTVRNNANEFCVTAAPGGAPITRGLCYGTDDMNLDLDSDVHVPAAAPGPAAAVAKAAGAAVPLPPVQQPPQPFTATITVWVWIQIGQVHVMVCVQVTLQAGMPGQALRQQIQQQLAAQGFLGNVITVVDPLHPLQRMDMLQLERTTAGDPIVGIEFQYDAMSRHILPNCTGAGLESIFGGYEYGRASQGLAPFLPWSRLGGPPPAINSFFDVFHEVGLPSTIGGSALSLGKSVVPVWNGLLLVDPSSLVIELGMTGPTGRLQRHWTIPNNQALVGFPLHSQGFAFQNGVITMSTGVATNIGP
jgi:hypothetical protein